MEILDIHTHHSVPQPQGIVSIRVRKETESYLLEPQQAYSVGIHPWDTITEDIESRFSLLDTLASQPDVLAIGEAGIDLNIGGPLFRQLLIFRHQVELSEELEKPLIIHDVKGHDVILGAHRDLKPRQNWAIHGFRQKPQVADMFIRAGFYLSFGAEFNPETVSGIRIDRILAETDDSEQSIEEVITRLSEVRGEDLREQIAQNSRAFLGQSAE
ncbi:MAG: TatD family hydrolase [Muribaculaceae bacterium]|nr:TatD family hydrolase [Muribaculaceae bacterium]